MRGRLGWGSVRSVRRAALILAIALVAAAIPAATAHGGVGALSYKGCISGELSDFDACTEIASTTPSGIASGLNAVESVTVSPDSKWVYAVARQDDSIARLKRDRHSGKLTYKGCVTGNSDVSACAAIPTATSSGTASGLDDVRALIISRDGEWGYAAVAGDDAIARFKRDPDDGKLAFRDCVTGSSDSGASGSGACAEFPNATAGGADSGLDHPKSLVLAGTSLYAAATNDAAIARFSRNPNNGLVTYLGCVTGETQSGPAGSGACDAVDAAGSQGDESGLDDARNLALARGGRELVGVSSDDDALFIFDRDRDTGALSFDSCLSGEAATAATACDGVNATPDGVNSGFDDLRSVAVSRDGRSLYVVSRFDAAITLLPLKAGAPRCLSADEATAGGSFCHPIGVPAAGAAQTGFDAPESVLVSRDGKSVYVSSANDAAVTRFKRNGTTGRLTHRGCITGEVESGPTPEGSGACAAIPSATTNGFDSGLEFPQFMAMSPDDGSLYAAIGNDDAVAAFKRAK